MKTQDVRKTDEIVKQLIAQLTPALFDIGFLRATIDNPLVGEKVGNSYSGHALDIAIKAVAMKTVLFVTRSWDKNGNSIPNFLKFARDAGNYIEESRSSAHPDWPIEFLEVGRVQKKLDALKRYENCFRSSTTYLSALRCQRRSKIRPLWRSKSRPVWGERLGACGPHIASPVQGALAVRPIL